MQPPAQAECGFQASGSASSAKGEQPFAVQNLASGDTLIKCSAGYGSQQDGENVHPVEGYSEEQHLPHARGDPQRLSASQEDPAQVTSTSPASKRGTPSMTLLLTTDPIEAGQETTNTPVHLADFSAATSICPNDPHRIPSLAGLDKDKIAAEQIIKTGRLPKASRLLASHQRHNIITSIDVSSSPMIEFVEATSADSAPVRDLTRPDQAGYNGLFPDPRPDPAQEDTTRVGGITQLLLKPFEQNDAFQEAAWRTALETTSRIKLPKHGKLRRAPAPRRAVTEAALLRNPALNGAAFVGRHVKLLDLRTRLWMLATVVSFNDTIGFRNTLVSYFASHSCVPFLQPLSSFLKVLLGFLVNLVGNCSALEPVGLHLA